jgi:dTDP-4-amino-4,6-dideoxygalactose transaminase
MKRDIPFLNLYAQYKNIKTEIDNVIEDIICSSAFIRGSYVDDFEKDFSKLMGSKFCISCANGTDALYISMKALGVGFKDEVIVPAHSWISTSETVSQLGAIPIFCDTNIEDFTIDVTQIDSLITNKTVGIIPVHLYGHPAEMDTIKRIAKQNNLWILEDCAQAHLASYKGQKVGTIGDAGSFSFYPGKNLGAMGDAGAIITDNHDLAKKMTVFARHGGTKKGQHLIEGINSRLDGLQAGILSVKMTYLNEWTTARQKIAEKYINRLRSIEGIILPIIRKEAFHVWHLFVIRLDNRDKIKEFLEEKGIQTGIHYPISLPLLEAYSRFGHSREDFPVSSSVQDKILSLPIYAEMTDEDVNYVCDCLKEAIECFKGHS